MIFDTVRRKDQIFALVAFSSFGTFVFLGLVPAHIYPRLLESMFVYMMFFIFLFLIFIGCYGEMKGWSDPSQPRHLKRLKKSDLKKSRRLLGINENAVVSSSGGGDNGDQGHDVETGFDSLQVPTVANPPSLLERCLPCLRRHGSIHPSEMSEKRRLTESQRRSYERCRELSNKRRPSIGGRNSCCCDLMKLFLPKSSDDLARVYPLEPTSTNIASTATTTSTDYSINNSDRNINGCIEVKVEKETSPQVSEKMSQEVEVESVDKPPSTTTTTTTLKGKDVDRIVNVKSKSSESRIESTETDETGDKKKKKVFDDDSNDSSNFDVTDFDHDR